MTMRFIKALDQFIRGTYKRSIKVGPLIGVFFALQCSLTVAAQDFLPPEKAFDVYAEIDQEAVHLSLEPVKGYYIYQDSIQVKVRDAAQAIQLRPNQYPIPKQKFDENFGKVVKTYDEPVKLKLTNDQIGGTVPLQLEVTLQGCAEKGVCYPPMVRYITISEYGLKVRSTSAEQGWPKIQLDAQSKGTGLAAWWSARDDLNALGRLLENASLPALLLGFFLLGIGLSFTPCMLPMLPILSSIVFGTTHHHLLSRKRTVLLAILYIAGMACAFSLAGMATAWFGSGIQAALQNSWIVLSFGLLMLVLAGSLLGFYEFHLPHAWHQIVDRWMGKQQGGSVVGAFLLGALSSLVASPCVTAPLAGVLTFIAQSGEVRLGGLILFVLACGMGVPLLLFALGASRLVPRAGAWMVRVQRFFGIIMILLAVWVVWPVVGTMLNKDSSQDNAIKQIAGMNYQVVTTLGALEKHLVKAKADNKAVFINFYADWCVSCKELERLTLNAPEVQDKLKNYVLIEVDVTRSGVEQHALLKQYKLFGPPGLIVIEPDGTERVSARSVGYISKDKLAAKL